MKIVRRRRRRRRRTQGVFPALVALFAVAGISWWLYPRDHADGEIEPVTLAAVAPAPVGEPLPTAPPQNPPGISQNRPAGQGRLSELSLSLPQPEIQTAALPSENPVPPTPVRGADSLIEAGRQALARNDLISARKNFSDAWAAGLSGTTADQVRAELVRIGIETVFSGRILPGDGLVDRYVIRTGDSLAKIANQHVITADLIASINGIADKHRIREGQAIKVVRGPLHAVVHKGAYRLDVYVGDVLVQSFPVGLGMDDSTPRGEWRVKNKLENPTYYPPRGGAIVSADDPANPLGERWIGLEGVSGEALSQERYGVHGTSEPDTIGKSVSLGCVRMQNADVEQLYSYLVEGRSTVTIVE